MEGKEFDLEEHKKLVRKQLDVLIEKFEENCPPDQDQQELSNSTFRLNPFLYSGTGGYIVVYYKLYLYYERLEEIDLSLKYLNKALQALSTNLSVLDRYEKKYGFLNKPSYLASGAGIYTIGALASSQVIDKEATKHDTASLLEKVEDYYDCCFEEDVEVELMNGLAGYLYCLLAVQTKIEG